MKKPEVARLQVSDAEQLRRQWLDGQTGEADRALGSVHKSCVPLDIEIGHRGELAWLGPVSGHPLRYLGLAPDAGCTGILETLGARVKQQLQERCPAC